MPRQLRREDYTVGWVCALPIELAAAKAMLDEKHGYPNYDAGNADENIYCMGSIAGHNVVIVCLPAGRIGTNPAATVATQMQAAFKGLRFGLMVGIGGGVPGTETDIRLGDVVVSQPDQTFGGVVQYDLGKRTTTRFERTGSLNSPPQILLSAVSTVQANEVSGDSRLSEFISQLKHIPAFQRSKTGPDVLFEAAYNHKGGATCERCSVDRQQARPQRESEVVVHYGTIASGNQAMRSAAERDKAIAELGGALCFEMEAAGLMNNFPCLVIRGICDYADSHKNKQWQAYAAGTAAAYAKELLSVVPAVQVIRTHPVAEVACGAKRRGSQSSASTLDKRKQTEFTGSLGNSSVEYQTMERPAHLRESIQPFLDEKQMRALLDSLRFDQIDTRQMTISNAHAKTCKWLLENPQYLNWLDALKIKDHHGFLWIKGKPGAGKSTLMKFALINARMTMENRIVVAFFFNARGEDIEKSTLGTYRSLLLQLLERLPPPPKHIFDSLGLSMSGIDKYSLQWKLQPLKALLEQAICALRKTSVVCFIDALDECDEEQIRDMIQFFEHIGELTVSKGIQFQVCVSSRHYPHITIRNGLHLVLEGQEGHTQDITNYLETELKIGNSNMAQQLRTQVQEKASGVFMWVILVVGILNKEYDRGQIHALRQRVHEIPSDLHDLFRDILTRDLSNKDRLLLCIQWVLFSKRPLSPEELYFAILSGVEPDAVSRWDTSEITKDVIKRFIVDSSKGLAEITTSTHIQRVQFIHESVRDFLLKDNSLSDIWAELEGNFQVQSHERLLQCCLTYISMDVFTPLKIPETPPGLISVEVKRFRETAVGMFPFLDYAVQDVLYHANAVEGGLFAQRNFFDSFSLPRWIKLHNLLEIRPLHAFTERVSLQYILAELDLPNLIKAYAFGPSCLEEEDESYGCPLFAAIVNESHGAFRACIEGLKIDEDIQSYTYELDSEYIRACKALNYTFCYSKKKGIFGHAANMGLKKVLACWIDSGNIDTNVVNRASPNGETPLIIAAEKGYSVLVKLLINRGADVNARSGYYGNALQAASSRGHKLVIKLLLDRGADVNAEGGYYGNALQAASSGGHKLAAKLLLDRGADINAQGGFHRNALQAASGKGNELLVKLLLDRGADVNVQSDSNALTAASKGGYEPVVKLLLDRGADVNAQGGFHGNALQAALEYGKEMVVKLLLDRGADINMRSGYYGHALQAASKQGYTPFVELLLKRGADVNAQGGYYGNALQAASKGDHRTVMGLLLDRGAAINAQGGFYGNALQAASSTGYEYAVKLLLDSGAHVNAQGGFYGNALQAASSEGCGSVVELLLNRGADINAQGGYYGNALQAASYRGHKLIVNLLLNRGADINAQGANNSNARQVASKLGHSISYNFPYI